MDKTSKDGEGTGFTNQDGNFNSENGTCHSSVTESATTKEGDLVREQSTRRGPSSPSVTSRLFAGTSQNSLDNNSSLSSASNTS